jgi:hypothetical protein
LGQSKARKKSFFAEHPICCFCGGVHAATTEDHWPPRSIFRDRHWPEGFVFPACTSCNEASRVTEKLIGLLLHGSHQDANREMYQKVVASVRREFPGVIEGMLPKGARDVRSMLRRKGLKRPKSKLLAEIPYVQLDQSIWKSHFDLFAQKMMLALHYQCFGTSLPADGRIWYMMNTNADAAAGFIPSDILADLNLQLTPQRNRKLLNEQFNLRWQFEPTTRSGVWMFSFHNRLVFTGITTENPEQVFETEQDTMGPLVAH